MQDFLCDFWKLSIKERRYFRSQGMKCGVNQCTARMGRVEILASLVEKITISIESKQDCCEELQELSTNKAYTKEPVVMMSCEYAKNLLELILKKS